MSPKRPANTVRTATFLPPEHMAELQRIAVQKGTTVSGLLRMIAIEYINANRQGGT